MTRLVPFIAALGLALTPNAAPAQDQAASRTGNLVIDFLDVGQGDAILVRSPEGKTALIDAGPSKDVVTLLRSRGVTSIDMVAVSHHHADHYGGMEAVIREFRPRLFLASNSSYTTPHYLRLLRLVQESGMQAVYPTDTPRKISLGSITLTVFPQPAEDLEDENDNSIGIRVQHGTFSALLTGDSQARERAYWERQVPDLIRDCTVLKLAHHGSRNGTDDQWLGLVRPKLAVASLGRGNEFGHPHSETLALLARWRIPLLRTDVDGTVTVVSDGRRWGVSSVRQPTRGPPDGDDQIGRAKLSPNDGNATSGRRIDINSASQEELESLPGIGPTLARRIIEGRPYRTVDDLLRVKGIAEKRLAKIRGLVIAR
jgi:competence ComEA-like helix-hairpin-helix protein